MNQFENSEDQQINAVHEAFPHLYEGDTAAYLQSVTKKGGEYSLNSFELAAAQNGKGNQLTMEWGDAGHKMGTGGNVGIEKQLSARVGEHTIRAQVLGKISQSQDMGASISPEFASLRVALGNEADSEEIDLYDLAKAAMESVGGASKEANYFQMIKILSEKLQTLPPELSKSELESELQKFAKDVFHQVQAENDKRRREAKK